MKKKMTFAVVLLVLGFSVPVSVCAEDVVKNDLPIRIVSDRLDAYDQKQTVIFSGNVDVLRGDVRITTDVLSLYYKGSVSASGRNRDRNLGAVEKIVARGNVVVTQGEKLVKGDTALYVDALHKIIVSGNAEMHEGLNIVRGESITYFLDERRGIVEGSKGKRVAATIYPDQMKREGK